MSIDPNNPIVKLCAEGIQAEMEGNTTLAGNRYNLAWEGRTNDYDACIIAHYMARIQTSPQDTLHWNLEALNHADKVDDDSVALFYPSLYLNIGKSYEDLGNNAEARKYYSLGDELADPLPDDRLGNMTRDGIRRGLLRLQE